MEAAAALPTDPPASVPEDALGRLYHGPFESFTSERNALAKRLRDDGEGEAAEWVKGLRKPTRAAWLVNQLAERKPTEVKKLLEVGEALRRGQEEMMAGSTDREALRDAAKREQKAVDSLLRTAEAIGREHRAGSQILDRVGETLQAASSDPEVAKAIELGRLERERRAASLGLVGAAIAPAPSKGKDAKEEAKRDADRRTRERLARRRRTAERKLESAEKRLERERTAVERAREALADRERRLEEAAQDVRAAKRELDSI
ncbi:MAG: hypothetical protein ACRDL6_11965 [Solirubrobacterales bacterium]